MISKEINNLLKKKKSLLAFNIQDINHLYPLSESCLKLKKKLYANFHQDIFYILTNFMILKKLLNFLGKKTYIFF